MAMWQRSVVCVYGVLCGDVSWTAVCMAFVWRCKVDCSKYGILCGDVSYLHLHTEHDNTLVLTGLWRSLLFPAVCGLIHEINYLWYVRRVSLPVKINPISFT
jgi:hypothetical protein